MDGVRAVYATIKTVNCAVFGFTDGWETSTGASYTGSDYNATDDTTVPVGSNNVTSLTFADQFESTTNDFRAVDTGDLQAGTPDATNSPDDISGLTRDATTPWIGCWEVEGAAPSGGLVAGSLALLGCGI